MSAPTRHATARRAYAIVFMGATVAIWAARRRRHRRTAAAARARRLELPQPGLSRPPVEELRTLIARDAIPDVLALDERLSLECVDERYFAAIEGRRGRFLRRLPLVVAQCVEIFRLRREVELILSWSEAVAIPVAALLHVFRSRPAHVAILMWISKPKKAVPLRLLRHRFDGIVIPARRQYQFAIERLRLPPSLVDPAIPWGVDARFWRPADGPGDMICCVGREMRDYPTLVEAIRPLGIPCHIAAGGGQGLGNPWMQLDERDLPSGVTLGRKSPHELRSLYLKSRFVVVPLLPTDSDNGITTILEAFAMGRAVICSDVPGHVGLLEEGVNCLLVPPGDVASLRTAIKRLWADPSLAQRLGAAGRELVETTCTTEQWVESIRAVADRALTVSRNHR